MNYLRLINGFASQLDSQVLSRYVSPFPELSSQTLSHFEVYCGAVEERI